MLQQALFLANFALLIFSITAFVELLVVFKRPIQLKLLFLGISFCYILYAILYFFQFYTGYIRGLHEFPSILLASLSILLISYLCYQKIVKKAIWVCFFIISIYLFFVVKYYLITKMEQSIPLESALILGKNKYIIRSMLFVSGVLSVNVFYFLKLLKRYNAENIYFKKLKVWMYWFISTLFFSWIINQLFLFPFISKDWIKLVLLICHFTYILLLFYRPKFLNHSNLVVILDGPFKSGTNSFNQDDFIKQFYFKVYYLNKSADLSDFCLSNRIDEEEVKDLVFNFYKLSFSDLVFKSRVEYFVNLIKTKENAQLSLEALAQMCGFNSRQHLYKWFKKFHGGSPSDLL